MFLIELNRVGLCRCPAGEGRSSTVFVVLFLLLSFVFLGSHPADAKEGPKKSYKILHIMSYHSEWVWNVDQFTGFQDALEGLDVTYKVLEMDTKRNNSSEWIENVSSQARELIEEWKPDIVYTNDDDAQKYITQDYVDSDIPFVFSAVNASPETYNFVGSANVTGVLEQEHFIQTVRLLKEIVPAVRKVAVVLDNSPMWEAVRKRIIEKQPDLEGIDEIHFDTFETYEDFKKKMESYQGAFDALGLLGIFHFKDADGEFVPFQEVQDWVNRNSALPDFSFWKSRVKCGTLCTVTVSGYEQGFAAGKIARDILEKGRAPSSFRIAPTTKGEPVVNLARARELGIQMQSDTLLKSEVITEVRCE